MSLVLLILGVLATGVGIVTIGFGIPINEFNLGNTLIVAGTTATAAGLVLIGLSAAVEQLTRIATALRPRAGARPVQQPLVAQSQVLQPQTAQEQGLAAAVRAPAPQFPIQPAVPPAAPSIQPPVPPGQIRAPMQPAAPRGPSAKPREERVPEPTAPEPSFSAIERLRTNAGRTDRHAEEAANAADPASPFIPVASAPRPVPPASVAPHPGANPAANGAAQPPAAEAPKKPPLDFLFRSRARAQQADPFEEVWPKRGGRREGEAAEAPPPAAAEEMPERPSRVESQAAPDDTRPPAVLKSGVVDGMAYTLYADGSIEAQLPQGTVRFGSIAELRSHIENSS